MDSPPAYAGVPASSRDASTTYRNPDDADRCCVCTAKLSRYNANDPCPEHPGTTRTHCSRPTCQAMHRTRHLPPEEPHPWTPEPSSLSG